ncbi:hypothetical protein LJJ44_15235 [Pseudomonas sp. B24_DOA]|nr:hypothetical protein LJJ44_15235 [Pseudomonas sp. B24_DOA]WKV88342.1 hypothetical protein LJU32_23275 [Pseudomonas sp. B21_DOA]
MTPAAPWVTVYRQHQLSTQQHKDVQVMNGYPAIHFHESSNGKTSKRAVATISEYFHAQP